MTVHPSIPDRVITFSELEKHDEDHDRQWIAIDGIVADVTEYKDEHPGGFDLLERYAGQDGTSEFKNAGHSEEAKRKVYQLAVGRLEVRSDSASIHGSRKSFNESKKELTESSKTITWIAAGIGLSAVGIGFFYYFKPKQNA